MACSGSEGGFYNTSDAYLQTLLSEYGICAPQIIASLGIVTQSLKQLLELRAG
jgi:hypothetical protein